MYCLPSGEKLVAGAKQRRCRIAVQGLPFHTGPEWPFWVKGLRFPLQSGSTSVLVGPSSSGKYNLTKLRLG